VSIRDNQEVHRGQLLLTLDRRDAEATVRQAEADRAVARSEAVVQHSHPNSSLNAAHAADGEALAGHLTARAELDRAQNDLRRMQTLEAQGAVAVQDADTARAQFQKALGAYRQSEAQHDAALARARINLNDTRILAPSDGRIGGRNAEPGRRVQPGQPLMVLVAPHPWVEAHFKETQLGSLRPGQAATIHVDAYPGRVFHGRLQSLAPASGARFALLPLDNATGNFTKVVQRVTARISLDAAADATMLVPGLSATVQVRGR
jgi:membrane fusion protein (multidrug efflux system)